MATILKELRTADGASYLIKFDNGMELWFDVWTDEEGEVTGDWNKYIFFTDREQDVEEKAFQEAHNDEAGAYNFITALDLARDRYERTTATQVLIDMVQKPCPICGGKLYFVAREDEDTETCLWCESCTISIDSSGGYLT